jgi:hypothetical protein
MVVCLGWFGQAPLPEGSTSQSTTVEQTAVEG